MKTNATTQRLVFTFGLLAASVGCAPQVVEPKALGVNSAEPKALDVNSAEPKAGDVIENSIKMKLAYIPPGEFGIGSPESEKEKLHQVKLTKGFYLGAYEVTQAQFEKVLGRNLSYFRKGGDGESEVAGKDTSSFPVERVSWFDAVEFCNALSKGEGLPEYYTLREVKRDDGAFMSAEREYGTNMSAEVAENNGKGYRLPTEAEWEYACRAGTKTPFHFGDTLNGKEANVNGNYPYGISTKGPNLERTREVGGYAANGFGLYDMHGNVWEWCNDWFAEYGGGDVIDPKGPDSGTRRVLRGGSFYYYPDAALSANRGYYLPTIRNYTFGFRVARTYPSTLPRR